MMRLAQLALAMFPVITLGWGWLREGRWFAVELLVLGFVILGLAVRELAAWDQRRMRARFERNRTDWRGRT